MAVHQLLLRGMLVGMLAGLIAFGFARIVGEPSLEGGIAFEEAHAHHHDGEADEPELVSRPVQQNVGLPIGAVVYGGAVGGLFALIFAFAYGRLGRLSPKAMAAVLASLCFVVFVVTPYLKYPANPPGANEAETIGLRTGLYFSMLAISIAAMAVALSLRRLLEVRLGAWNASVVGVLTFVVLASVAGYLMPAVNETPTAFPAATLWAFRLASLGIQAILWTVIGIGFGLLTERSVKA